MRESAVNPDHAAGIREQSNDAVQVRRWADPGAGHGVGNTFSPTTLAGQPRQYGHESMLGRESRKRHPERFRPMLRRPCRTVGEHHLAAPLDANIPAKPAQVEHRIAFGLFIAEGGGEQAARPIKGMPVAGDGNAAIVAQGRGAFAGARCIVADAFARPCPTTDHGTLDQALGVKHKVISAPPEAPTKRRQFRRERERRGSPTPEGHLDDLFDAGGPGPVAPCSSPPRPSRTERPRARHRQRQARCARCRPTTTS